MFIEQSEANFNKRIDIIKQIALINGYTMKTIQNIFQIHLRKQAFEKVYLQEKLQNNYKKMKYFGKLQGSEENRT